jgi:23S rRNA (pseudouridine1915-N3)-methyltransferase
MRLLVAAVGRLKSGPERDLADRYRDRAAKTGRSIALHPVDLVEVPESRAARAPDRMAEEAAALAKVIPAGAVRIVLDSRGSALTSEALAEHLARWRDAARPAACLLIGGADGLADNLKTNHDLALSFGAATWPHQLVRIMLLEQLYRATTILSGHPYHRA